MYINEDKFSKKSAVEIVNEILAQHDNNPSEALVYTNMILNKDGLNLSKETKDSLLQVAQMLTNKIEEAKNQMTFKTIVDSMRPEFSLDEGFFDKFKKPTITSKSVDPSDEKIAKLLNEPIFDDTFEAKLVVYPPFKKEPDMITVMDARALSDPKIQNAYHILRKRYPKSPIRLYSERGNKTFYENSKTDYEVQVSNNNGLLEFYNAGNLNIALSMAETLAADKTLTEAVFNIIDKKTNETVARYNNGNWQTELKEDKEEFKTHLKDLVIAGASSVLGVDPAVINPIAGPVYDKLTSTKKTKDKDTATKKQKKQDKEDTKKFNEWKNSSRIKPAVQVIKNWITSNVKDKEKAKLVYDEYKVFLYDIYKKSPNMATINLVKTSKTYLKKVIKEKDKKEAVDDNRKPDYFVKDAEFIRDRNYANIDERIRYAQSGLHPDLDDYRKPAWIVEGYEKYFDEKAQQTYPQTFKLDGISQEQIEDENGNFVAKWVYLRPYIQKDPTVSTTTPLKSFLQMSVQDFKNIMNDPINLETLMKFEQKHPESPEDIIALEIELKQILDEKYPIWKNAYWDKYELDKYDEADRASIYLMHKNREDKQQDLNVEDIAATFRLTQQPENFAQDYTNAIDTINKLARKQNKTPQEEEELRKANSVYNHSLAWVPAKDGGVKEIFQTTINSLNKYYPELKPSFNHMLYDWANDESRSINSLKNIINKIQDRMQPARFTKIVNAKSKGLINKLKKRLSDNRFGEDALVNLQNKLIELSKSYKIENIEKDIEKISNDLRVWLTDIAPIEIKWENQVNRKADDLINTLRKGISGKEILADNIDLTEEFDILIEELIDKFPEVNSNVENIKAGILDWVNTNLPEKYVWYLNLPEDIKKQLQSRTKRIGIETPDNKIVDYSAYNDFVSKVHSMSKLTGLDKSLMSMEAVENLISEICTIDSNYCTVFDAIEKGQLDKAYVEEVNHLLEKIVADKIPNKLSVRAYAKHRDRTANELKALLKSMEVEKDEAPKSNLDTAVMYGNVEDPEAENNNNEELRYNLDMVAVYSNIENPEARKRYAELFDLLNNAHEHRLAPITKNSAEDFESIAEIREYFTTPQVRVSDKGVKTRTRVFSNEEVKKEYRDMVKQWLALHGITPEKTPKAFREKMLAAVLED